MGEDLKRLSAELFALRALLLAVGTLSFERRGLHPESVRQSGEALASTLSGPEESEDAQAMLAALRREVTRLFDEVAGSLQTRLAQDAKVVSLR